MAFYAIAIGREQKITQSWSECFELTNKYSGSKYKKCPTYEAAEKFISEVNSDIKDSLTNNFELEQKMIPAFTNNPANNVSAESIKTEIYIAADHKLHRGKVINMNRTQVDSAVVNSALTVSTLLSTLIELRSSNSPIEDYPALKKGDSRLNNYLFTEWSRNHITVSRQELYLVSLINCLKILKSYRLKSISIYTDSNYLLRILSSNIFKGESLLLSEVAYEDTVKELYMLCREIPSIYLNYYSGKIRPDKLDFAKINSVKNNKELIEQVRI